MFHSYYVTLVFLFEVDHETIQCALKVTELFANFDSIRFMDKISLCPDSVMNVCLEASSSCHFNCLVRFSIIVGIDDR